MLKLSHLLRIGSRRSQRGSLDRPPLGGAERARPRQAGGAPTALSVAGKANVGPPSTSRARTFEHFRVGVPHPRMVTPLAPSPAHARRRPTRVVASVHGRCSRKLDCVFQIMQIHGRGLSPAADRPSSLAGDGRGEGGPFGRSSRVANAGGPAYSQHLPPPCDDAAAQLPWRGAASRGARPAKAGLGPTSFTFSPVWVAAEAPDKIRRLVCGKWWL